MREHVYKKMNDTFSNTLLDRHEQLVQDIKDMLEHDNTGPSYHRIILQDITQKRIPPPLVTVMNEIVEGYEGLMRLRKIIYLSETIPERLSLTRYMPLTPQQKKFMKCAIIASLPTIVGFKEYSLNRDIYHRELGITGEIDRFVLIWTSRQLGKSTVLAIYSAIMQTVVPNISIGVFAAIHSQASIIVEYDARALKELGTPTGRISNLNDKHITVLHEGSKDSIIRANPNNATVIICV